MLYKVISKPLGNPAVVSEDGGEKQNILLLAPQRQCFRLTPCITAAFRRISFDYVALKRRKIFRLEREPGN